VSATALDNPAAGPNIPVMSTRRHFLAATCAALVAPGIIRAQSGDLRAAVAALAQLHSLQVQRGDEVIFAEAPRGPGLDRMANIKSCSKSVVALLLGAALDRGDIPSVTATLGQVAPGIVPQGATPGAADITMEDLVTLRAGLERTSGANYGGWVRSRNWLADALGRPMVARPGGRMLYSTGSTHILGAALAEATGRTLLQQARERLGAPLGIEIPGWTRDPQGYYLGGNEMALRPTAMLKIATLMRDGGRFDGQQVVSQDWITRSRVARTRSQWSGLSYGYGWFLSPSGYTLARGYGGQIIAAHPDMNLAVAITSDPTLPARSEGYFGDLMRLLDGPVLAAA
jgi:CubicO group peptidase (beta-lactamase class C family)